MNQKLPNNQPPREANQPTLAWWLVNVAACCINIYVCIHHYYIHFMFIMKKNQSVIHLQICANQTSCICMNCCWLFWCRSVLTTNVSINIGIDIFLYVYKYRIYLKWKEKKVENNWCAKFLYFVYFFCICLQIKFNWNLYKNAYCARIWLLPIK